jgi:hypothetical protein
VKEKRMKYLCQVWLDGARIDALASPEKEALDRDSLAYDRWLERNGHFVAAEALQSPSTAVTVRVRDGKASSTDGPFIETKEHLGGFILIEARDMDEAVRLAGGIPLARMELASIEVRPIYEFG